MTKLEIALEIIDLQDLKLAFIYTGEERADKIDTKIRKLKDKLVK